MLKNKKSQRVDEAERAKTLSNEQLFEEYSYLCNGDDYDGCLTEHGQIRLKILAEELQLRLVDCGFLKEFVEVF